MSVSFENLEMCGYLKKTTGLQWRFRWFRVESSQCNLVKSLIALLSSARNTSTFLRSAMCAVWEAHAFSAANTLANRDGTTDRVL